MYLRKKQLEHLHKRYSNIRTRQAYLLLLHALSAADYIFFSH